jgi:hypothetical protein
MLNAQHSAASHLWYTPTDIIDRARRVLGGIDLDPASDAEANAAVGARRFLTASENGLVCSWEPYGGGPFSVFLNPPGGRGMPLQFWARLMDYRKRGLLKHAVVVAYSIEQLQLTQGRDHLSMLDFAVCVPDRRLRFVPGAGGKATSPTHANAIVYVDGTYDRSQEFRCVFADVGKTKL